MRARPRPLEVVAAQPAGDVHHLADEVQAGLRGRLHGLLRQRARVDAAQRHLGLLVAFGAGGRQFPARQLVRQPRQRLVGGLVDRALPVGALLCPGIGQAAGHQRGELVGDQLLRPCLALRQRPGQVGAGREVDGQRRAGLPIAGDLQHRRPREAAVREQQVFQEGRALLLRAGGDLDGQRQPGQLRIRRPGVAVESERHEARAAFHQRNAELLRQPVAEVGRADLGDGEPARGHHQAAGLHRAAVGIDVVGGSASPLGACRVESHLLHGAGLPVLDLAGLAFGQQHPDQVFGRSVREELALVLLVVGDAVAFDQRDEVRRGVARQRRARELRVLSHEVPVGRTHVQVAVGEVAAPAAGDADLLGHLLGMVDEQHLQPPLAGLRGAEQAGGAGTDDDGVEPWRGMHQPFQVNGNFSCLMNPLGT